MSDIQLTRLSYDINGNPRYVCHYSNLLTEAEKQTEDAYIPSLGMTSHYAIAVYRSHKIGGRKYHNKTFGGGIVFTDYESQIRHNIKALIAEAESKEVKS